jgi:hypothetical protein
VIIFDIYDPKRLSASKIPCAHAGGVLVEAALDISGNAGIQ